MSNRLSRLFIAILATTAISVLPPPRLEASGSCNTIADCADLNGDLVRDDVCVWWACVDGQCVATDVRHGDIIGPQSNGFAECEPDGGVDYNDVGPGVVACFSNIDWTSGSAGDTCEDNPPQAMRADVGGRYGACEPDGVCDMNDIYIVQLGFSEQLSCACPLDGPAPANSQQPSRNPAGSGDGSHTRLFMAVDGTQNSVPQTGNTVTLMAPGQTLKVMMWLEDEDWPEGKMLQSYQLLVEYEAIPLGDAQGSITYVDPDPGAGWGGDSILVDTTRPDWIFEEDEFAYLLGPAAMVESPSQRLFGIIYATIAETGLDVGSLSGPRYLAEFEVQVSADAFGEFELRLITDAAPGDPRPLTDVFVLDPLGAAYGIEAYQNLTIIVGDPQCASFADCGDVDEDGIRDNACQWYSCHDGLCLSNARVSQADVGGTNGTCLIDGTVDAHDRFHALNCFSDTDTLGNPASYPCEPSLAPRINVDAVGSNGTCTLDGVCDANDAFAALNAFSDIGTNGLSPFPCGCGSPAPYAPAKPQRSSTSIALWSPQMVLPGDLIEVDVYIEEATESLRGYQLHVGTRGGDSGALELVDVSINADHPGYVFQDAAVWTAYNLSAGQVLVGMDEPLGVPVRPASYLATYTYRASSDAGGTFVVDALYGDARPASDGRTFLFGAYAAPIAVDPISPAIVTVAPQRQRLRRASNR